VGDIAFWDHRTTLHAGVNDYDRSESRRGRRANIGSAKPVPAA
jgi:alpha-ketoglutarate-dependent taurine dioxygenase